MYKLDNEEYFHPAVKATKNLIFLCYVKVHTIHAKSKMLTFLKQHILLLDVLSVWLDFLKFCCNTICRQPLETQEQSNFEQDVSFLQFAQIKKTKSIFCQILHLLVMLLFHLF